MDLIVKAYYGLFPERVLKYRTELNYSGRFKGYNGNVMLSNGRLIFNISKQWKSISDEITMGLLQELMGKLWKVKTKTINMDLYNNFLKKVHIAIPKTKSDPTLESSFVRLNDKFFGGMLELPNLSWCKSINKLGSYEYGTDSLEISRVLSDDFELLDYVMFHEMLHKHFKFKNTGKTVRHHTPEFRKREREFPYQDLMEKRLEKLVKHKKLKNLFF